MLVATPVVAHYGRGLGGTSRRGQDIHRLAPLRLSEEFMFPGLPLVLLAAHIDAPLRWF